MVADDRVTLALFEVVADQRPLRRDQMLATITAGMACTFLDPLPVRL